MVDIEQIISRLNRENLPLDERETTFTQTGDDRSMWRVFSNDDVWIRRLYRKGARIAKWDVWGVYFDLDDNQVRIFQPLTEEQRQKMAANAAQARAVAPGTPGA